MPPKRNSKDSTANLGFEQKLWLVADKLRNNMDAAEYKHVILGLIFLSRAERDRSRASVTQRASIGLRVKYISDSFEEHQAKLVEGKGDYAGANPEDPDDYRAARQTARNAARRVSVANQYFLTQFASAEGNNGGRFEEKMPRLVTELNAQFAESAKLEAQICKNLPGLGYGD